MKHISLLLSAFSTVLFICSCSLDTKISNEWTEDYFWTDSDMTTALLTSVYGDFFTYADAWNGNFLDAATDNAITRVQTSSVYKVGQGGISNGNNPIGNWTTYYNDLQRIHMFLKQGLSDKVCYDVANTENDPIIKKRLEGEAYFLRAYTYFNLLKEYGGKTASGEALGVPIVTKYIEPSEAENIDKYKRSTYAECIDLIVADCERAIEKLPLRYAGTDAILGQVNFGRASGISAAALKLRALVYAASPAYQPENIVKLDGMGTYTIVDQAAYKAKWEKAAKYGAEVITMLGTAYTALNYSDLCDASEYLNNEFLLQAYNGQNNNYESRHYPPFYYGQAQTTPSENLAEAFPARNGFPISDARSGYNSADPYACQRDKRFDGVLFYQGKKFGSNNSTIDIAEGGKDSMFESPYATRTGYYLSKFLNTSSADFLLPNATKTAKHVNPLLRAGEVWLNFAEASFEAWGAKTVGNGCTYSAYDVIKTVREKSGGITDLTYLDECAANTDAFRKLIHNERRIEFAFENQRFWDLRRWLAPLNETVTGMKVERSAEGVLTYTIKDVEERPLDNVRYYYFPIPEDEMLKGTALVNNLGW